MAPRPAEFALEATRQILASSTSYGELAVVQEAPLSLTASDGTGLALTRLDAAAVVQGPLAFTELRLRFHNPEDRVREGTFAITLPAGAAISRFAMRGEAGWMEAEVVERMTARRVYEDFLHRKQDPALLEQAGGNQFSARVFPIPARADKELIVSYSQERAGSDAPYVLPLRGLPQIAEVTANVRVADAAGRLQAHTLAQAAWQPDRDFAVAAPSGVAAVGAGAVVAARVRVPGATAPAPLSSLALLVDTSASRALGWASQVALVEELVAALRAQHGDALRLEVAAFDQEVRAIFAGPIAGFGASELARLREGHALGASDLGGALAWVQRQSNAERVLVLGDGVVTAGDSGAALQTQARALGSRGVQRIDVGLLGAIHDLPAARALVAALPQVGVAIPIEAATGAADLTRRLALPVRADLTLSVDGAAWTWPATAAQAQPGDELVVYGMLRAARRAGAPVGISVGGTTTSVAVAEVTGPLVQRAAAAAEVARLEAQRDRETDPARRDALREQIVRVSTRQRVLSSETALLVLETDADYARYGLGREGLADILVVGTDGVALQARAQPVVEIAVASPPMTLKDESETEKKNKADGAPGTGSGDVADGFALDSGGAPMGGELTADVATTQALRRDAAGAAADAPAPPPPSEERPSPRPAAAARRPEPAPVERARAGDSDDEAADSNDADGDRARATGRSLAVEDKARQSPPALTGRLAQVVQMIAAGQLDAGLREALAWRAESPGDVLALLALGEAFEARREVGLAARAYGSIIDLFPARADLRRFAGERLERLGDAARALATDTYRKAVADRPDHLSAHRLLAMSLARQGDLAGALAALEAGLGRSYPDGRFRGGERVLREDAGLVAAAWIAREPSRRAEVLRRLAALGGVLPTRPSTRFVLYWETDANDVDFHIHDARGGHAFYSSPELPSGGSLYADVTTGYGPECFTIEGAPTAGPYRLEIHYYSRGPMGYGMGVLEVLRHDGKGGLTFEHRPYVAMNDGAYVDLGAVQ